MKSNNIPICTDITQTFEIIIIAYYTGLLHLYTFKHNIFGFILLPETSLFWSKELVDEIHERNCRVIVCGKELNKVEKIKNVLNLKLALF